MNSAPVTSRGQLPFVRSCVSIKYFILPPSRIEYREHHKPHVLAARSLDVGSLVERFIYSQSQVGVPTIHAFLRLCRRSGILHEWPFENAIIFLLSLKGCSARRVFTPSPLTPSWRKQESRE